MSALTDGCTYHLLCDLEGHLDPYQISMIGTGADLWPDATPQQAAAWYLAHSLFKKYNDQPRPSAEACERALQKFLECNNANAEFSVQCETLRDEELIQGVSDEIYRFWYGVDGNDPVVSSFGQLYSAGRVGPGASRKARANDFYTKLFDSPLSHTSDSLCFLWQKFTGQDPRFFEAEQVRCKRYGFRKVGGNALSFVNKNVDVARGIATEPTINMWFQLGMAEMLYPRLIAHFGIDIQKGHGDTVVQPTVNRAMARLGSLSGRLATIDMESASDLISLTLVKRLFPKQMLAWFMQLRSPTVRLPCGQEVELHSISTMGNGFTFPLMTMLFCAIIATVYRHMGIPLKRRGAAEERNFAVFGDDLIVVSEAVPLLKRVLSLCGFRVNHSKSYVEGPFRESCGADFYLGEPVRGVYIKRLRSPQDHVVAINSLNRWSAMTGISLEGLVTFLVGQLRRISKGPILWGPPDENDDACVHVPLDMARGTKRLHHGVVQYVRWIARPTRVLFDLDGGNVTAVGGRVSRRYSPEGVWLSILYGALRGPSADYERNARRRQQPANVAIGTVQANGDVRYGTKPRVSASWDTLAPKHLDLGLDWRRWSGAVRRNLNPYGCVG